MNETEQAKIETTTLLQNSNRLAFTKNQAAEVLGISRWTLWRLIRSREIYPTKSLGLISRAECLRWLGEQTEASKRTKRFPSKKLSPANN